MTATERTRPAGAPAKDGQLKETERVQAGPAAPAAARWAAAWSGRRRRFGPSARRLLARLRPERAQGVRRHGATVVSVVATAVGPWILGRATDLIFAGLIGRHVLAAGVTQGAGRRGAARAWRGQPGATWSRHGRRPRQGVDFSRRRPTCCWSSWRCTSPRRCWRGSRATSSTTSCRAPCCGCAPRSRTRCTGCRWATSTSSRAASCSAASPTTSTTSARPCSRR